MLLVFCITPVQLASSHPLSGHTISGKVYYSTQALAGVDVELIPGSVAVPPIDVTTTAADGSYTFLNVSDQGYTLKVDRPGPDYVPYSTLSILMAGSDLTEDLYLPKRLYTLFPDFNQEVETNPVLCWSDLPEAARYEVKIVRSSDWQEIEHPKNLFSTCYKTRANYTIGMPYVWEVTAFDMFGHKTGLTDFSGRYTITAQGIGIAYYPGNAWTLTSLNQDISVTLPDGSIGEKAYLNYQRQKDPSGIPGLLGIDHSFSVVLTKASDFSIDTVLPGQHYSIHVTYSEVELDDVIESTLALYYWNGSGWLKEDSSQLDSVNHVLTAAPDHFATWAVLAEPRLKVFLPNVAKP